MKRWGKTIGLLALTGLVTLVSAPEVSAQGKKAVELNAKGNSHYEKGEYDKAIEYYKRALEYSADDDVIWTNLGRAYLKKGSQEEALRAFVRALEANPKSAYAYQQRGDLYFEQGKYDEAISDYNKALEHSEPDRLRTLFYDRAAAHLRKGWFEEALGDANRALERTPPNDENWLREIHRLLALVYLGLGDGRMAETSLQNAKTVSSYDLFRLYSLLGDKQKALSSVGGRAWLGVALRADPKRRVEVQSVEPSSPADRGGIESGDIFVEMNEAAVTSVEQFVNAVRASTPGTPVRLRIRRGKSEYSIQVPLGSQSARMESQLASDPNTIPIVKKQQALATATKLEEQGELGVALQQYLEISKTMGLDNGLCRRVIRLAHALDPPPDIPEEARKHFVLALAAAKDALQDPSRYDLAIAEYRHALQLAPWWAEAYWNLAVVQEELGKYIDAAKSLEFYLLAAPNDVEARKIQDKIYELEYKAKSGSPKPNN